jgi:hypothetical protein
MHHIEAVDLAQQLAQGQCPERREVLVRRTVVPQGLVNHGHQPSRYGRITRCEQGDIMAPTNQFLRQGSHHAFGAAVAARRHGFEGRRDLRDAH